MTDSPQGAPLVGTHHTLSSILNHIKAVALGHRHDGVHLAGDTGIMNRDNSLGSVGDGLLDEGFIQVQGIRPDIHKNNFRAAQNECVRSAYKSIAWHDDLVARLGIDEYRGKLKCMCARRR